MPNEGLGGTGSDGTDPGKNASDGTDSGKNASDGIGSDEHDSGGGVPTADPSDEAVVRTAAEAAEGVVFARYDRSAVTDIDVTVTFEDGVLDVDVYLNAPGPEDPDDPDPDQPDPDQPDPEAVAAEAVEAAGEAVDELFEE